MPKVIGVIDIVCKQIFRFLATGQHLPVVIDVGIGALTCTAGAGKRAKAADCSPTNTIDSPVSRSSTVA